MSFPPSHPIIAIIGTTGTGKSQLAVSLALQCNGEIINADAVQMYDGLPVITNKITVEEQKGVRHHLLGCIGCEEETWRVGTFVKRAGRVIQEIRERGRVPIVVGGTHYYVQSLLFKDTLAPSSDSSSPQSSSVSPSTPYSTDFPTLSSSTSHDAEANTSTKEESSLHNSILHAQPAEMLIKLQEVDPIMAGRWHPNDVRKIRRSLEIYLQTGRKASDVYAEQASRRRGNPPAMDGLTVEEGDEDPADGEDGADDELSIGSIGVRALRYPTLFLWTCTPRPVLRKRLHDRVDGMVAAGLIEEARELESFARKREVNGLEVDRSRGVWISIGFKEMLPYLSARDRRDQHDRSEHREAQSGQGRAVKHAVDSTTDTPEEAALLATAIAQIKSSTWQYAKRQERWIRIKLLAALRPTLATLTSSDKQPTRAESVHIYALTASSSAPEEWSTRVEQPAMRVAQAFLAGAPMPHPASVCDASTFTETLAPLFNAQGVRRADEAGKERRVRTCDLCGVTAATTGDWDKHMGSSRHKRAVKGVKRRRAAVEEGFLAVGGGPDGD